MDWSPLFLSLRLSFWTTLILTVVALLLSRALAWREFRGKGVVEAVVALPLVLPPTVLGYYLLVAFGQQSWLGQAYVQVTGHSLAFSFSGVLLASVIYSLPFAVQPMLRAFEGVPAELREAAWTSGLGRFATFMRVELPLAWPGMLSAMVLCFAHTMGEFGVVLMVGGNIPDETRTVAIAIYDHAQAFDDEAAAKMSLVLLIFALVTISVVYSLNGLFRRRSLR